MLTTTEQPVKFWPKRTSYSAISTFERCPLAYKLYYYDGISTPSGPAADRGTRLHKACERFLKGEIPEEALPIDFWQIKPMLRLFKDRGAKAEEIWLVGHDWTPQENDGSICAFKAIIDIHYLDANRLFIWDLKSGKAYDNHGEQLQSYAAIGFAKYPEVESVITTPLYLEGPGHSTEYPRNVADYLQRQWKEKWETLFSNTNWEKNEGPNACRWCDYPRMGHCDSPWSKKR